MGWNSVNWGRRTTLSNGMENEKDMYFVHSYQFKVRDEIAKVATSEYGHEFTAVVNNGKTYGVQFHPEKARSGQKLIKNFLDLDKPC